MTFDPLGKILGIKKDRHSKNEESKVFLAGPHKGKPITDKTGYYAGYCQCGCDKCTKGDKHCQGRICMGD